MPLTDPDAPQTPEEKARERVHSQRAKHRGSRAAATAVRQEAGVASQLAAASSESHADFEARGFARLSGCDHVGRRLLVLVGASLPPSFDDSPPEGARLARYVYGLAAAAAAEGAFSVVYFHTDVTEAGRPRVAWLFNACEALPERLRERLDAVFVVHPAATLRGVLALLPFFLAAPWASGGFSHKVQYVDSLRELYQCAAEEEAVAPPRFVVDADAAIMSERAKPVPRSQVKAERAQT